MATGNINQAASLAPRLIQTESRQCPELVRKIKSRDLFGSAQSILIEHEGSTYCLRATKFGKLLITK
jgi:hemin uptake protein HemP